MPYRQPARTTYRPLRIRRLRVLGLLIVVATSAFAYKSVTSPSFSVSSSRAARSLTASARTAATELVGLPHADQHGALGEANGAVPDGTTLFDDSVPGVARLDPALLGALRRAAADAAASGVHFVVNSGWRSPAYEDELRREAIAEYGSEQAAARWVATGTTSPHVSGAAVDLGPADATPWLATHGAAYGLCQIYGNEPWHFELRPDAAARGCPPMYADPTHDPRMQP